MGKAIRASLLVLLFACSAQAGYMPNESPAPPPSQPGIIQNESPTSSEPASGVTGDDAAASWTQVVLDLFAVMPSLP